MPRNQQKPIPVEEIKYHDPNLPVGFYRTVTEYMKNRGTWDVTITTPLVFFFLSLLNT